ncbi:hypothetical protein M2M59_06345 [Rummeliibacillus sp. G93]|uniref:Uncharacterized protein n=1 Tax=Rummeliibacillus stabekisii TaxID=241244 RepID=A0A143HAI9_9BACL|nr:MULTISPECIES: hypothetical protein [Rummeliibacillus]AMW98728.1 hypothetical protein ATY39_04275 [Rummeliibacillus stabekisii]MBB5169622.1 hypothetical protein [Rummeliibacillus stabekisii]MCM3316070.1 hypothetical protein [Rummeliibacillus stabekisii]UQW98627.1 hypothetical protein M2M59_06345 [Rummeliibacillus sp. G93]GEL03879.1 hypothetical protein RST01_05060 [Rummeliibacillus stabekisii]
MSKRLLQIVPLIEIENFQGIRIRGDILLEAIHDHQMVFIHENFKIKIEADSFHVNLLRDELLALDMSNVKKIELTRIED